MADGISDAWWSRAAKTVLLVDDTRSMREATAMVLEQVGGWEITGQAADGAEAVDLAREDCPQVIVLDQQMPRLTGLEALPLLRQLCPDARIVMWSSDSDVRHAALQAGADAFVDKSAPLDDLLEAIGHR